MANSYALIIGINKVDPIHYAGWDGALNVCENDAIAFSQYLKNKKIKNLQMLLTKKATRENVLKRIDSAAKKCISGDLFILYYSGHGGNEIPDINGDESGTGDGFDETWCLFDGELIDDELLLCWKKFKAGVRIIVVSDSCFSGDIIKFNPLAFSQFKSKQMPSNIGHATYKKNKSLYDQLLKKLKSTEIKDDKKNSIPTKVKATILQISSSQEWQPSIPETDLFPDNSLFTAVFLQMTSDKKLKTFTALINKVKAKMPDYQKPKSQVIGSNKIKILSQIPFKL